MVVMRASVVTGGYPAHPRLLTKRPGMGPSRTGGMRGSGESLLAGEGAVNRRGLGRSWTERLLLSGMESGYGDAGAASEIMLVEPETGSYGFALSSVAGLAAAAGMAAGLGFQKSSFLIHSSAT